MLRRNCEYRRGLVNNCFLLFASLSQMTGDDDRGISDSKCDLMIAAVTTPSPRCTPAALMDHSGDATPRMQLSFLRHPPLPARAYYFFFFPVFKRSTTFSNRVHASMRVCCCAETRMTTNTRLFSGLQCVCMCAVWFCCFVFFFCYFFSGDGGVSGCMELYMKMKCALRKPLL